MSAILKEIDKELAKSIDLKYKEGAINFFKEPIKLKGVKTPIVRKIAGAYFQKIKTKPVDKIFSLSEKLLKRKRMEERIIAFDWVLRLKKEYEKKHFKLFERWLERYVSNWADCDDFCTRAFGCLIFQYPEFLPQLNKWAKSKNRWKRRAAAVTLIYGVRKRKFLKKIFEISKILLLDDDDLVQKGYGWALKEAGNQYQRQVFNFVMKNKNKMPRTALRYAIEKMPKQLKKKAMN